MFYDWHAFLSVHCSLLVTCWEKATCNLLPRLYVMFSCFNVTFPCDVLGQVRYLIVLIPDIWPLTYFHYSWAGYKDYMASVSVFLPFTIMYIILSCHFESRILLCSFETIRQSLMIPKWLELARLAKKICKLYTYKSLNHVLLPKDNMFKNIYWNLATKKHWIPSIYLQRLQNISRSLM